MKEKEEELNEELQEEEVKEQEVKEQEISETDENEENAEEKEKEEEKATEKTTEELLAEMTDKYMRTLAEVDNTRKRAAKEKDDFVRFARSESIREFLPVLDNLDRAIHTTKHHEDVKHLKKGIEMVISQFEGIIKKMGLEEIKTKGHFDPELHHVMHREHVKGKKDGEIVEVYQKGYTMNGNLIRPAMVKVASKDADPSKDSETGSEKKDPSTGSGQKDDK